MSASPSLCRSSFDYFLLLFLFNFRELMPNGIRGEAQMAQVLPFSLGGNRTATKVHP